MRISRSITAIVLGVGLALAASGQEANRQEVIPVDDPAYRYLDLLLLETGLPQPSSFRPYTAEEFNEYIDLIPLDRLSGPGRELLDLLIDRLHPRMLVNSAGGLGFSSSLQTSLEYYTKADA